MHPLDAFFRPGSIAVVGASPDMGKIGGIVFKNIMGSSARGNIYPINTHEKTILGINKKNIRNQYPLGND